MMNLHNFFLAPGGIY